MRGQEGIISAAHRVHSGPRFLLGGVPQRVANPVRNIRPAALPKLARHTLNSAAKIIGQLQRSARDCITSDGHISNALPDTLDSRAVARDGAGNADSKALPRLNNLIAGALHGGRHGANRPRNGRARR